MDKGKADLRSAYKDNFWELLPIERMQVTEESLKPGEKKNPNFERSETKATKAIQKHSMYIDGTEKNPQMDEAHLMLGQARYYEQRFIPALEAFNYILYKYPESDKIYEAKIWREKTNMRLDNDAIAISNLRKLLTEIKFKDQIFADANAALAQAFLNVEEKDSAVARLKLARDYTKYKEEKARYLFILGQLYEQMDLPDSAYVSFQAIINMKRKAPKPYVINAHAHQSLQLKSAEVDTTVFLKKYQKLLEDRENRPFLDALNHQLALFYDRSKNYTAAQKYYNASLKNKSQDQYMVASNYRNLAAIYFENAQYALAGKYYDSTMTNLDQRSREFKQIKKKRENLQDVIRYELIAREKDSILNVLSMTVEQRIAYYEAYIEKLKKEEKERAAKQENEENELQDGSLSGEDTVDPKNPMANMTKDEAKAYAKSKDAKALNGERPSANGIAPSAIPVVKDAPKNGASGSFYFYNPTTVAYGKNEFRKIWGDRAYKINWRSIGAKVTSNQNNPDDKQNESSEGETSTKTKDSNALDERYTTAFYISKLPTRKQTIDSLYTDRNFAYYQLGLIYKEKFREYKRAADKLEALLENNPEERLVLPAMHHLYKIYELTATEKAAALKAKILGQYPDSRYAQILEAENSESLAALAPEAAYNELFKRFEAGEYLYVLKAAALAVDQYTGDEIVSKIELLKANVIGKLRGIEAFKTALNYVALNYPNAAEGKKAEEMLSNDIPKLESLKFMPDTTPGGNWKIIYRTKSPDDIKTTTLIAKVNKFMEGRKFEKIKTSFDCYTESDNFLVLHGFSSREAADGIATILRDHKDFKVEDTPILISSWNYQIVQMRKNLEQYLSGLTGIFTPDGKQDGTPAQKPPKDKAKEMPAERIIQDNKEQDDLQENVPTHKVESTYDKIQTGAVMPIKTSDNNSPQINTQVPSSTEEGIGLPPTPVMPNKK